MKTPTKEEIIALIAYTVFTILLFYTLHSISFDKSLAESFHSLNEIGTTREYCISECSEYNAMAITNGSEWRCVC